MSTSSIPMRPVSERRTLFSSGWLSPKLAPWLRHAPLRRAITVALSVWVPLVILAAASWRVDRRVPFATLLADVEVHVRFLFAVPLLVLARKPISIAIDRCVAHFTESEIIDHDDERFAAAVKSLYDDLRSRFADIAIFALALFGAITNPTPVGAWGLTADSAHLNWAGAWYAYVAAPVHQFLLLRWLYRWIDWDLFIVRTARLRLRLHATHADRSGGLAFLGEPAIAFGIVLFASSTVLAARWSAMLAREPHAEPIVRTSLMVYVALVLILAFAPLLVHMPRLVRLRRDAIHTYGAIAQRAAEAFYQKWHGHDRTGEAFLQANDACAMCDYSTDFAIARSLRIVPIGAAEVVTVLLLALVPLASLALVNKDVAHALTQLARALI